MVKHFCDICGKELRKNGCWSQLSYSIATSVNLGTVEKEASRTIDICPECLTELRQKLKEKENDT